MPCFISIFICTLYQRLGATRYLNRVTIDHNDKTTEKRYLEIFEERLRSIAQDSTGILYIGTASGKLLKVSRTTGK